MNQRVNGLIKKEVSRQEFLVIAGLAIGSILGLSTIIKLLTGHSLGGKHLAGGYGSSAYGGGKDSL